MQPRNQLLALADFQILGRQNPETAVLLLQSLLIDEAACPLRIAWLREVTQTVRARQPARAAPTRPAFLARVLDLVAGPGILISWRQGQVSFAELEALTRAPRALYEAHCCLLDLTPQPWPEGEDDWLLFPADLVNGENGEGPPSGPSWYTSQTSMSALLGREEYERFRERLEKYPLLDELLATIELSSSLDGELLRFIQDRCRTWSGQGDLIETMLGWLRDFAIARNSDSKVRLSRDQFACIVRRVVARYHLECVEVTEPFEVAFRDAAFAELRRDFHSGQEVVETLGKVRIPVAPESQEDFMILRRQWIARVREALKQAEEVWKIAG